MLLAVLKLVVTPHDCEMKGLYSIPDAFYQCPAWQRGL